MRLNLHWKRPLFYLLLPVLIILVFVGFPIPLAPPRPPRAAQEQSTPAEHEKK